MALHPNGEAVAAFEPIQPIRTWGEGPAIQNQLLESLMKKVLLISASVLALSAGAAFAQNYQSTYQNGTGNTVGVDQTATAAITPPRSCKEPIPREQTIALSA